MFETAGEYQDEMGQSTCKRCALGAYQEIGRNRPGNTSMSVSQSVESMQETRFFPSQDMGCSAFRDASFKGFADVFGDSAGQ